VVVEDLSGVDPLDLEIYVKEAIRCARIAGIRPWRIGTVAKGRNIQRARIIIVYLFDLPCSLLERVFGDGADVNLDRAA
jgi:hypothetical protein